MPTMQDFQLVAEKDAEIERLRYVMAIIHEHAQWGIKGTPDYRLDRLKQIEKTIDAILKD